MSIKHQLVIRTAYFSQKFSASENIICCVFSLLAISQSYGLLSTYGDGNGIIKTVGQLTNALHELVYQANEAMTIYIYIYVSFFLHCFHTIRP